MKRTGNKSLLPSSLKLNLQTCVKSLLVIPLLLSFSTTVSFAQDKRSPDSYRKSKRISALLEKEQFKVGLSCDEAMQAYNLDKNETQSRHVRLESPLIGSGLGKSVKAGFLRGSCRDKQLTYVRKIVSVADSTLEEKVVFDTFIDKYGAPDLKREKDGRIDLRYYLMHQGHYTAFSVLVRQEDNQKITIYELEDNTPIINSR